MPMNILQPSFKTLKPPEHLNQADGFSMHFPYWFPQIQQILVRCQEATRKELLQISFSSRHSVALSRDRISPTSSRNDDRVGTSVVET